ncbi:MAG: hypothetical protein HFE45_04255 [Oscillospiraceae bacterium]|jgi:hypothetical protein|nr:hypothetical protein [Oscillospiraceae bacterium]
MSTISVTNGSTILSLDSGTLHVTVEANGRRWQWAKDYTPVIRLKDGGEKKFSDAMEIRHSVWKTGVGDGIRSTFRAFPEGRGEIPFTFETIVWVESSTGNVFFEWIPLCDEGLEIEAVCWPGPMEFDCADKGWYSVLNIEQGLLLPNNWPEELTRMHFGGQLCSAAAYMPWFGQVRPDGGYIAIAETPWDAAYSVDHPAGGPYAHVAFRWLPSLGKMDYRRVVRCSFLSDCDYNDLCKVYRAYVKETGHFVTLAEKALRNPMVDKLIGAAFVHKGIKTHVSPNSDFFDPAAPDKNNSLTPFSVRTEEVRRYHALGVEKLYYHLDGWGDPGYDNKHPDYLPACEEAGGWAGMKTLSDTMQEFGYMFGIHDQYRDYYFDAPTFDKEFAIHDPDGGVFEMARWAGGRQSYLCASQAPYYVKRNFEEVLRHGIHLEGAYLDVFTCNEPDECAHPEHRMTRRQCLEYRAACFDYLTAKGIAPSSEECVDWAVESLVFCHYGPHDFMLAAPGSPRKGIPAPLFNLVYHECMILPWPMDHLKGQEDYMLYALLNGGAAYMDKDGAYPGVDGAFGDSTPLDEKIARWRIVAELQEKVAKCELVRHELVDGNPAVQRSTFSDGTTVTVNFSDSSYDIVYG